MKEKRITKYKNDIKRINKNANFDTRNKDVVM